MSDTPHEVQLALAEFDRSQLPEAERALQGDDFRRAVQEHLSAEFIGKNGAAEVVVTQDRIIIRWTASPEARTLTESGITFLKEGESEKGIAQLRMALQRNAGDADALLNLGMALSDRGDLAGSSGCIGPIFVDQPGPCPWVGSPWRGSSEAGRRGGGDWVSAKGSGTQSE